MTFFLKKESQKMKVPKVKAEIKLMLKLIANYNLLKEMYGIFIDISECWNGRRNFWSAFHKWASGSSNYFKRSTPTVYNSWKGSYRKDLKVEIKKNKCFIYLQEGEKKSKSLVCFLRTEAIHWKSYNRVERGKLKTNSKDLGSHESGSCH